MPPPRVYMTVSRSGQTRRPNSVMSSPVFPMTVISAAGAAWRRPRRKRAAPTPPASTVMRITVKCGRFPGPLRPAPAARVGGAQRKVTAGYRYVTHRLTIRNQLDSLSHLSRILGQRGDHYHLFRL